MHARPKPSQEFVAAYNFGSRISRRVKSGGIAVSPLASLSCKTSWTCPFIEGEYLNIVLFKRRRLAAGSFRYKEP